MPMTARGTHMLPSVFFQHSDKIGTIHQLRIHKKCVLFKPDVAPVPQQKFIMHFAGGGVKPRLVMLNGYIFVCGGVVSPWQIAAIRWGQHNNFSFLEKQSSVLRQPWWQRLIERVTFKHRAVPLESPPSFVSMPDDQGIWYVDMRGTNDVLLGNNLILKPFFNNSFDAAALAVTLIDEQVPVLGWAGRTSPDEPWRVLAKADIAVRDPLGFEGALFLCGERLGALLEQALEKKHFGEVFIPDESTPRVSFVRLALKQLRVRLKNILIKPFFRLNHWQLAVCQPGPTAVWHTIDSGHQTFEADPVIWSSPDGTNDLFFELSCYGQGKTVIAHRHMSKDGTVSPAKVIITQPHNLSYPHLFFWQGNTYMALCTDAGGIKIFRAVDFPQQWVLERKIMAHQSWADATLHHDGRRWWLFASPARAYIPNWDELVLFYADDPFGDWRPHPANPIVQSATGGRMAGSLFEHEGRLFRPGQDCRGGYGRGVVFAQIDVLTPEDYQEKIVPCLVRLPEKVPGRGEWHTFAYSRSWCVLDYKKRSFITRHLRTHPTNPAQNPCTPGHRYDDQRRQFSEGMLRCGK